jgi:hypothetical protein
LGRAASAKRCGHGLFLIRPSGRLLALLKSAQENIKLVESRTWQWFLRPGATIDISPSAPKTWTPLVDYLSGYHFSFQQWTFAVVAALCLGLSKTGFTGVSLLGIAL